MHNSHSVDALGVVEEHAHVECTSALSTHHCISEVHLCMLACGVVLRAKEQDHDQVEW